MQFRRLHCSFMYVISVEVLSTPAKSVSGRDQLAARQRCSRKNHANHPLTTGFAEQKRIIAHKDGPDENTDRECLSNAGPQSAASGRPVGDRTGACNPA